MIRLLALLCFFVFLAIAPNAFAARTQPNVLLIITDDQGYGDFSIHGNPHLKTPHIDKLGRESVRFERFYVNSFCAPTRAALLTGRWPLRTGCHGVTHNREAMKPSELTMAEALKSSGYRTACIGIMASSILSHRRARVSRLRWALTMDTGTTTLIPFSCADRSTSR